MGVARSDGRVRRVVIEGVDRVRVDDASSVDDPDPGQVLVRARDSLISSGTELSYLRGTNQKLLDGARRYPVWPGYSMVGEVIAIDALVQELRVGDVVFAPVGHASIQSVDASVCVRTPREHCSRYTFANLAAVADTARSAARVVNAVGPVAVFGLGVVGNLCAQLLRPDFDTTGFSRLPNRVASLAACGVRARPFGEVGAAEGFGTVVEAVGSPESVAAALAALRPGGCLVLLGSPRKTMELDVYRSIHERGVTLIGAHARRRAMFAERLGEPTSLRDSLASAVSMIERHALVVDPLISCTLAVDQVAEGYRLLAERPDQVTGVVLDWK